MIRSKTQGGGMTQKEEVHALDKIIQVIVFGNAKRHSLSLHVWESGGTIRKTKLRVDLSEMSLVLEMLDLNLKCLFILDVGLDVRIW